MSNFKHANLSISTMLERQLTRGALTANADGPVWVGELRRGPSALTLKLLALHGVSGLSEELPDYPLVRLPLCGADDLVLHLAQTPLSISAVIGHRDFARPRDAFRCSSSAKALLTPSPRSTQLSRLGRVARALPSAAASCW